MSPRITDFMIQVGRKEQVAAFIVRCYCSRHDTLKMFPLSCNKQYANRPWIFNRTYHSRDLYFRLSLAIVLEKPFHSTNLMMPLFQVCIIFQAIMQVCTSRCISVKPFAHLSLTVYFSVLQFSKYSVSLVLPIVTITNTGTVISFIALMFDRLRWRNLRCDWSNDYYPFNCWLIDLCNLWEIIIRSDLINLFDD